MPRGPSAAFLLTNRFDCAFAGYAEEMASIVGATPSQQGIGVFIVPSSRAFEIFQPTLVLSKLAERPGSGLALLNWRAKVVPGTPEIKVGRGWP